MHHYRYLKIVLIHKWHVFRYACKLGIPVLGLLHDCSKFRPSEWMAHARWFGVSWEKEAQPIIDKVDKKIQLDLAWWRHQKRNRHHWQYWIAITESGTFMAVDVPIRYRKEMLADWLARHFHRDEQQWKVEPLLHPDTREWLQEQLQDWPEARIEL